ncbi:MAG: hypothetical protein ACYSW3_09420 [Planctomycetota bacterium]
MVNDSGSPTLINCVFDNNKAYSGGGGFHNSNRQDSNTTLVGCVFKEPGGVLWWRCKQP